MVNYSGEASKIIQWNLYDSNTDSSFTMAKSKSFLSPYEIFRKLKETSI